MSLYYISNGRSSFLKRRGKFFLNSILEKPVVSGFKRVQRVHRGRLTGLRPEGCGIALGHTYGVKVLRIDRPDGRRVRKFDGLSGRGLRIAALRQCL